MTYDKVKLALLFVIILLIVSTTIYLQTATERRAKEQVLRLQKQLEMAETLEARTQRIEEDTQALRTKLNIVRQQADAAKRTAEAVAKDVQAIKPEEEKGGLLELFK